MPLSCHLPATFSPYSSARLCLAGPAPQMANPLALNSCAPRPRLLRACADKDEAKSEEFRGESAEIDFSVDHGIGLVFVGERKVCLPFAAVDPEFATASCMNRTPTSSLTVAGNGSSEICRLARARRGRPGDARRPAPGSRRNDAVKSAIAGNRRTRRAPPARRVWPRSSRLHPLRKGVDPHEGKRA